MSRTAKLFISYCYFPPCFFFLILFSPSLKMSVFPEFSFPFNDLDEADFNLAIYEMQNGPVRYDADRLASLSFNPLLHNIRTNLARSFDLDPDTNLRDLFSDDCEYFIEDQFNDMLSRDRRIRVFVTAFLYCI